MTIQRENSRRFYRRYLPHIDQQDTPQMITFRLADSLPRKVVLQKLDRTTDRVEHQYWQRWLDRGAGKCVLGRHDCAQIVENALRFYDSELYTLMEWVIMPNHVHFIYEEPTIKMHEVMRRIKSYTSREIKKVLGRRDNEPLWLRGYYDRYARSARHLGRMRTYTVFNPVLAGLVSDPFEWEFSSIYKYEEDRDSIRSWWDKYGSEKLYRSF